MGKYPVSPCPDAFSMLNDGVASLRHLFMLEVVVWSIEVSMLPLWYPSCRRTSSKWLIQFELPAYWDTSNLLTLLFSCTKQRVRSWIWSDLFFFVLLMDSLKMERDMNSNKQTTPKNVVHELITHQRIHPTGEVFNVPVATAAELFLQVSSWHLGGWLIKPSFESKAPYRWWLKKLSTF